MDVQATIEQRQWDAASLRLKERLERMRAEAHLRPKTPREPPSDWLLVVEPLTRRDVPAICRMRSLLKSTLRRLGFRAKFHAQVTPHAAQKAVEAVEAANKAGA